VLNLRFGSAADVLSRPSLARFGSKADFLHCTRNVRFGQMQALGLRFNENARSRPHVVAGKIMQVVAACA
jgi:hypothetical protein